MNKTENTTLIEVKNNKIYIDKEFVLKIDYILVSKKDISIHGEYYSTSLILKKMSSIYPIAICSSPYFIIKSNNIICLNDFDCLPFLIVSLKKEYLEHVKTKECSLNIRKELILYRK